MQDVRQPGNVEASLDIVGKVVARPEFDPVGEAETGNSLFGETAGRRQIKDHRGEQWVLLAEMNRIGPGTAAQVQESPPPVQVDAADDPRGNLHGEVEHPHQEAFPRLLIVGKGNAAPDRPPLAHRLVQAGPACHQMMMVEDDVAQVFRRGSRQVVNGKWGRHVGFADFFQQIHGRQGGQQHAEPPLISIQNPGEFMNRPGPVGQGGEQVELHPGMQRAGAPVAPRELEQVSRIPRFLFHYSLLS